MPELLASCRLLHFAATMLLFGAGVYRAVLALPPPAPALDRLDARLRPLLVGAALLGLVTAVLWLMLEAGSMGDGWAAALDPATIQAVLGETSFGRLWRWRLALAALLLAVVAIGVPHGSLLRLALAGLLLGSLGLTGHALIADGAAGLVLRAAYVVHLLAAGAWLGGLVALAVLLRDGGTQPGVEPALHRFSGFGYFAVGLVLATGAINTSFLVKGWAQLLGTVYGRLLLAKLVLVAAMVGLALLNRLVLLPRLARSSPTALGPLGHSLKVEVALGAVVLALVSVLGMLPPAGFAAG